MDKPVESVPYDFNLEQTNKKWGTIAALQVAQILRFSWHILAGICRKIRAKAKGKRAKGAKSRFKIQDSGFKIQNSGFKIQDSGFKDSSVDGQGFKIQDSRFRIQDSFVGGWTSFEDWAPIANRRQRSDKDSKW